MTNQSPEQKARDQIDSMLTEAGWVIQNKDEMDFSKAQGIAVREYQTDKGPADYVLFIDGANPVGVIEAKREEEGHRMSSHEKQSHDYSTAKLKWVNNDEPLPFVYESTGLITRFTDYRDPKPRAREVFSFFKPETLFEYYTQQETLRKRFSSLPALNKQGLYDCQVGAIEKLEDSFRSNQPRALIQMATGSGKTFTAITFTYRLLKHVDAKRVLFLVDTKNLGEQAEQEFQAYLPNDDNRKFIELYNVSRLNSRYVPKDSQVCISTIQRMYSILKGEELPEDAEQKNPYEYKPAGSPKEIAYNPQVPPETFDFIIVDECHRSIYNLWRQVLEYFDAFLIGLTATPDKRTYGFFNENVVSEYKYEKAVADGILVPYNIYAIETEITRSGANIKAGEYVDYREKLTRKQRWEKLDDEIDYAPTQLDKKIVNKSTIRHIIRTFRDKVNTEVFPGRKEVPKTLIFAKNDNHAEDIIEIVREEFGEENKFCQKVTYNAKDPRQVISDLRNDYYPRIAVTVDMIATGTDVKPLECLIFMRDVKSRNYFEQMLGRGTRTLGQDELKKVTASAISAKTHFVVVDAIGVTKSVKVDTKPFERKPTESLMSLMSSVMMGSGRDEDTFSSLANRLARLDKQMSPKEKKGFIELSGGKSINTFTDELLNAFDPDEILEQSHKKKPDYDQLSPDGQEKVREGVSEKRAAGVAKTLNGKLIDFVVNVKREHEQIIDLTNLDTVEFSGWSKSGKKHAKEVIKDFRELLEAHKDEVGALGILYNEPYRRKEITYEMISKVLDVLKKNRPALAPFNVWKAYEQLEKVKGGNPQIELTALISLIRHVCDIDRTLTNFESTVNSNFKNWVFQKNAGNIHFTEEQMDWLRLIKDHMTNAFHIEKEHFNYAPFDNKGGIGRMYQLFGQDMNEVIEELNENLVA